MGDVTIQDEKKPPTWAVFLLIALLLSASTAGQFGQLRRRRGLTFS